MTLVFSWFRKRWGWLLGCLTVMILVAYTGLHPIAGLGQTVVSPASEIRGVWLTNVDSEVLFESGALQRAIAQLAQANFNTLYPVVWNWGYTTYPSAVMQRTIAAATDPRPAITPGRDMVAELVQAARSRRMAVLPWFEFGFMVPEDSALAIRHPDWLTQKQNGQKYWLEGRWSRVWLNPLNPEVQTFMRELILEIVTRYPVDGIQLDDHFGLPYEFGYDPYTIALYQREHGGRRPPTNAKDPEWVRWRANKITDFLRLVFRDIKSRNENILVALSPNNYEFSLNHSLQDWRTWEQEGLIEELVVQAYRDSLPSFIGELNRPEVQAARRHIPTGAGILSGLKDKPVPIQRVQEQVQAARRQGLAGVSFFFYETLWNLTQENAASRQAIFKQLFPTYVPHPNIKQGWRPSR